MKKNTYQAVLFAPDGAFVTDFRERETKQDVWNEINEMGSRWIFYPICFVGTDTTIVDAPEGLEYLIGRRIKTVKNILASCDQDNLCEHINNGWPLNTAITEPETAS
jgi:hypothetical protein